MQFHAKLVSGLFCLVVTALLFLPTMQGSVAAQPSFVITPTGLVTLTPVPPTNTAVPPTAVLPTNTAVPPTAVPPTNTAVPPTAVPPTAVPPTAIVPTNTPVRPTATTAPAQPTATLQPGSTPIPGVEIADPVLMKQVNPAQAQVGDQIEYVLTVTNVGTSAAQNVVVTDPLPAFAALINATTTRGIISVTGNTVIITIGEVAPGDVITIRIRVRVASSATAPANINTASLTTTSSTNVISNDTSTVSVQIPQPSTVVPATATPRQPTAVPPPSTAVPPSSTAVPPSSTAVPPTATPRQPTATPRRATATPQPPSGGGPIGLPDTGSPTASILAWAVFALALGLAGITLRRRPS